MGIGQEKRIERVSLQWAEKAIDSQEDTTFFTG
jgi:hypothetical protein